MTLKVEKRNGELVDFDKNKIIVAIKKAMNETTIGVDENLAQEIAGQIENVITISDKIITVEDIQDMVEESLATAGRFDASKRYILYRAERAKAREGKKQYNYLSESFLSQYKHKEEPFKFDIGKVTYYRTYSRPIPEENRREYWWETVARVVEFSSELEYRALLRKNGAVSIPELNRIKKLAERMYDLMFNLKLFPSGRSLWVGGVPSSYDSPLSNFNCSFLAIDSFDKFSEMLLVLMLGTGVGLSVERKYIDKLPKVNSKIEIAHKNYKYNNHKKEHTELLELSNNTLKIVVGDSRFGWAKALELFFNIITDKHYSNIENLIIDYDYIRPYGSRIRTFGGHASGHEALQIMISKIYSLFSGSNEKWVKVKPIHALDIATSIAEGVVAGGTRRSALIVFCDEDDKEVITAKQELYIQDSMGNWEIDTSIAHRSLSNNTILYEQRPSIEQLKEQFELIRYSGEPSFGNLQQMRKRRSDAQGGNPLTL